MTPARRTTGRDPLGSATCRGDALEGGSRVRGSASRGPRRGPQGQPPTTASRHREPRPILKVSGSRLQRRRLLHPVDWLLLAPCGAIGCLPPGTWASGARCRLDALPHVRLGHDLWGALTEVRRRGGLIPPDAHVDGPGLGTPEEFRADQLDARMAAGPGAVDKCG